MARFFFEIICNKKPTATDEFRDSRLLAMAWNKKAFKNMWRLKVGKLIALFIVLVSFCLMLGLGGCAKAEEEQKIMEKPKDIVENVTEQSKKSTEVAKDVSIEPITETEQEVEQEAVESKGKNIAEETVTTQEENMETSQTVTEGGALVEESSEPITETVQDTEQEVVEPATMPETESLEEIPGEKNVE